MRRAGLLALASALAACSGGGSTAPGEDAELNAAAATLEANSADVNAAEIVDEPEGNVAEPEPGGNAE